MGPEETDIRIRETSGYTQEQAKILSDLLGIKINPNSVIVSRSQEQGTGTHDSLPPTGLKSCSVLHPDHVGFYGLTGFLIQVDPMSIPWVSTNDAGTPTTSQNVPTPAESKSLDEYLKTRHPDHGGYSETIVDFDKDYQTLAVFDLRALPTEPSKLSSILSPKKYRENLSILQHLISSRNLLKDQASKLGVPFLTELGDERLQEEIRTKRSLG